MNAMLEAVRSGSVLQKSLFLMVCGISFVFTVQVVFYLFVKLWPRNKEG